jgi:hypothetical protein
MLHRRKALRLACIPVSDRLRYPCHDIHAKPPGDRGPDLSGVEFLALYFTALEDIFCERLKDRLLAEVKSESFHVADQPALLVSDRSERLGVSRSRFQ